VNLAVLVILPCTFVLSIVLIGFARGYALKKNIVDLPNSRSSHRVPTPRAGGIGIAVSYVAALCGILLCRLIDFKTAATLIIAGCAIAAVGFLDDLLQLSARTRLAVHLAAAVFVVVTVGGFSERALVRWGLGEFWIGSTFAVLVLVWGTNLFNFMDGIDGLAASESIFVSGAGGWLYWLSGGDAGITAAMLGLAAASLGCLVWNWPPARIFMGDVGSGFLGFVMIALYMIASQRTRVPIEILPILGGVFLTDATTTLVRRFFRGDRLVEAHRMHAYQHLARKFGSHRQVTLMAIAVNLFWLLPWAYVATRFPDSAQMCLAAALLPLVVVALIAGAGRREQ